MKRVTTSKYHILSTAIASMIANGNLTITIRKNMTSFDFIAGGDYVEPMLASLEKKLSVLENWKLFCKNRIRLKEITWKTRYLDHIIQQTQDNYKCGVYFCYFFYVLINQKFCGLAKDFIIDNLRKNIFLALKSLIRNLFRLFCGIIYLLAFKNKI